MDNLHLNLTATAKRHDILALLKSYLEQEGVEFACPATDEIPDKHHHEIAEVNATIDGLSQASEQVRSDMRAIYQILAEAEAAAHGVSVDETHFHEVGNAEGLRCTLEICTALELLGSPKLTATPVQVGSGTVTCAHGELEIPAPATKAILDRFEMPIAEPRGEGELCTPTSAAIIAHFVESFSSSSAQ